MWNLIGYLKDALTEMVIQLVKSPRVMLARLRATRSPSSGIAHPGEISSPKLGATPAWTAPGNILSPTISRSVAR